MSAVPFRTLILCYLCYVPVCSLIRPRLNHSRHIWVQRSKTNASVARLTPLSQSSSIHYKVFDLVGPKESYMPPYSYFLNSAGPKPPAGYHFSAGPKPTSRPLNAKQQFSERRVPHLSESSRPTRKHGNLHSDQRRENALTRVGSITGAADGSVAACGAGACPQYVLVERQQRPRHEVRRYPRATWLSFIAPAENYALAELEATEGIRRYRNGHNELGITLSATYPVVTQLALAPSERSRRRRRDSANIADFTVSVPLLEGEAHPRPLSNQLVLDSVEEQTVFVTSFWARAWRLTERFLRMRIRRLSRGLQQRGETHLTNFFYLAKYHTPTLNPAGRHYYELWLYSTPQGSRHRFRPLGKALRNKPSAATNRTRLRLCRDFECPQFEVLREYTGGIQRRHYYNAAFATVPVHRCDSQLDTLWRSREPLLLYKQGVNTHLAVVEDTRPALVVRQWYSPSSDGSHGNATDCRMTSMVYLPSRLHRSPPNALQHSASIGLSYIHELTVYVLPVGDAELQLLESLLPRLKRRLDALRLCYRTSEHFLAVYEPPARRHGRLNELWLVARVCG